MFGNHIRAIEEKYMNLVELVQFIEQANALVQSLKASGVYDKVVAAEQAIQTELQTDPVAKELIASVTAFFAKHAAVAPVVAPKVS
jgi:hypothetical protein